MSNYESMTTRDNRRCYADNFVRAGQRIAEYT